MTLKLKYTILYVDDVSATLDFFVRAFGFRQKALHESAFGELDTGDTTLSFCSKQFLKELGKTAGKADYRAPVFEVAFETEDVPGALSRALSAGATLVQDARDEPWGQTTAYVSEPNGFLIELCTPVRK